MKLQSQNPSPELNQELSSIFDSPPASPCEELDILGTSNHSPSGLLANTTDDEPCSILNQHLSARHDDEDMNGIAINDDPLISTLRTSIGKDQNWMAEKDHPDLMSVFTVDQRQFNYQSLPGSMAMHPHVPFSGLVSMCSQTVDLYTIPGTIESNSGQVKTKDFYVDGSTWPLGVASGRFCQLPAETTGGAF